MRAADPRPDGHLHRSGAVLELDRGFSVEDTVEALRSDARLGRVAVGIVRAAKKHRSNGEMLLGLDLLIARCRSLGFDASACDRLDRSIRDTDAQTARSLIRILQLLMRGSPFLLIRHRSDDTDALLVPELFSAAIAELFDVSIEQLQSIDEVFSVPFERQPPRGLILDSDRKLFEVLTCPEVELEQRWNDWLTSASIDDQDGIQVVASLLQERLQRIGVTNTETGRLTGLRRRAWFSNALMRTDSVEIVRRLAEIDIAPVFTGHILDALDAEQADGVRKVQALSIHVAMDTAQRALTQLTELYEPISKRNSADPLGWSRRSMQRLRLDADRSLSFRWRWLPERGDLLVPLTAERIERFEIEGTPVLGLSPAARLVELCSNSASLRPGLALTTVTRATELIDRHHARIDWEWVRTALERLDLVEHARLMVAQLPERTRELVAIQR